MNSTIRKITETLLFEPFNYKGLHDGVHELHRLFSSASGVKAGDINDKDIYLPAGKAISPIKAAHCLLDLQRTAVFIRGIYKAILQLQKDFPNERLHILYAGCGPYATLLTPLTTFFKADELRFHLLDINETSLDAAKLIYNKFELNDFVDEWICADAVTYQIPQGETRHLIISETMQNALKKEPQVGIMMNLIPQLPAKGLFIPQEITITGALMNMGLETRCRMTPDEVAPRISLGAIYTISRENPAPHRDAAITIPGDIEELNELNLLTDIITFGDEKLGTYNCGLNMPFPLFKVDEHKGKQINFHYRMGEEPGFEYEWNGLVKA
jgi:predicted RNA methylase